MQHILPFTHHSSSCRHITIRLGELRLTSGRISTVSSITSISGNLTPIRSNGTRLTSNGTPVNGYGTPIAKRFHLISGALISQQRRIRRRQMALSNSAAALIRRQCRSAHRFLERWASPKTADETAPLFNRFRDERHSTESGWQRIQSAASEGGIRQFSTK